MVAALDPALGIRRGTLLTVSHGGKAIVVKAVDVCGCAGRRIIDLTSGAFSRLAPLSSGVIDVVISGAQLPATDTED
jgi:rare lipoprotein A (peptidoglycan hydrolase)